MKPTYLGWEISTDWTDPYHAKDWFGRKGAVVVSAWTFAALCDRIDLEERRRN